MAAEGNEMTPLTQKQISASVNMEMLTRYTELRVMGHTPYMAAKGAEVPYDMLEEYTNLAETNPTFIALYKEMVAKLDEECGWSRKVSILRLMETINDPYAKRSDKTNAIKEINMLVGITAIDDKGRTILPSLKDFFENPTK